MRADVTAENKPVYLLPTRFTELIVELDAGVAALPRRLGNRAGNALSKTSSRLEMSVIVCDSKRSRMEEVDSAHSFGFAVASPTAGHKKP